MIICAGRSESFDFAHPIGVGLVESAMNLTKLLLQEKPDSLLFIGSAGSYGNYKIFDIVTATDAVNIELGFLANKCYTPLNNADVPRETSIVINSSNYITTDALSAKRLLTQGIELENMEFFSLVRVAKEFGIAIKGIFVVTNYCDTNAHDDFKKNHKKAKQLLTEFYEKSY